MILEDSTQCSCATCKDCSFQFIGLLVSAVSYGGRELCHAPLNMKTAWCNFFHFTNLPQGSSRGHGGLLGACRRRRHARCLRTLQAHPTLALKRRAAAPRAAPAPARRARTPTGSPGAWGRRWERGCAGLRTRMRAGLLDAGKWAGRAEAHVVGERLQLASSPWRRLCVMLWRQGCVICRPLCLMGRLCLVSAGLWGGAEQGSAGPCCVYHQAALSLLSAGATVTGCGASTDTEHDGERVFGALNQALT